ncbi:hypothetical protein DVH05_004777 [Phytophthora capsici]|nr:hypothetical protein DVH05_004777 [Phytophthora capsici]
MLQVLDAEVQSCSDSDSSEKLAEVLTELGVDEDPKQNRLVVRSRADDVLVEVLQQFDEEDEEDSHGDTDDMDYVDSLADQNYTKVTPKKYRILKSGVKAKQDGSSVVRG